MDAILYSLSSYVNKIRHKIRRQMNEIPEAKRRLAACDSKLRNWEWRFLSHEVDSSVAVLRDAGNVAARAWFVPDGSEIVGLTDRAE